MKTKLIIRFIAVSIMFLFVSCSENDNVTFDFISEGNFEGDYFPTQTWRYCSPEEVGVNEKLLINAHKQISSSDIGTEGYLIIKDGYIIAEDYFGEFDQGDKHSSFSVAKSFTSAVIGIAIDKGFIESENDLISEYYTELNESDVQTWKKDLKIEHMLTMTSGLDWSEEGFLDNDLANMVLSSNYVDYVLSKDVENQPGEVFTYNSGESMLLSGIINLTTGKSMKQFAEENLFNTIGISDLEWDSDSENHTVAGWGISTTMENFARFGYLFLKNGNWDGQQLISETWISKSTSRFRAQSPYYGYLWWLNDQAFFDSDIQLPDDCYMAIGALGQYIIVVPSYDLLIVRVGTDTSYKTWKADEFINLVIAAIENQ
jgi:CubicO group peptidase (beta-lactamase class C family)